MVVRLMALAGLLVLSACGTPEQRAIGNLSFDGGLWGGAPVYRGDINRKYRVIREVRRKEVQISGPNYYDWLAGAAWVSALGRDLGADAVIEFDTKIIKAKCWNLFQVCTPEEKANKSPEYYEAWGTAVKFVD